MEMGIAKREQLTTHEEQIVFLKKIEGQVRGVQKMIGEKRYCVDILTEILRGYPDTASFNNRGDIKGGT
jgi:hypothetical protein